MCLRLTAGDHCSDEVVSGVNCSANNPPTILSAAVPPQSFCNVVLRLTAFLMQALGQMAFSLEVVCSQEGVGAAAERLEAVLCHILIPIFLMAAVPGKEAPQFQAKDLVYCLNLMYNSVCPPLAKQSLAPVASGTLATSLIRGATHGKYLKGCWAFWKAKKLIYKRLNFSLISISSCRQHRPSRIRLGYRSWTQCHCLYSSYHPRLRCSSNVFG